MTAWGLIVSLYSLEWRIERQNSPYLCYYLLKKVGLEVVVSVGDLAGDIANFYAGFFFKFF